MALDVMDLIRQREESQRMRSNQTVKPAPLTAQPVARRTTATRSVVEEPEYDEQESEPPVRSRPVREKAQAQPTINDRLRLRKAVRQAREDPLDDYEPPQKKRRFNLSLSPLRTLFTGMLLVLFPALGAILSLYFAFEKNKGEAGYLQSVQMLHISQAIICMQLIVMLLYFVYWKNKMTKQLT